MVESSRESPWVRPAAEGKAAAMRQGMLIAWWAAQGPDRPAVYNAHGDRTFGELNENANRLVRALRRQGLGPGDSVALMCTNRAEFIEVLYATQRGGFRFTPLNWHLTADEAGYIVENCEARAFLASADVADAAARAARIAGGDGSGPVGLAIGGEVPGFSSYAAAIAAEDGSDIEDPVLGSQMLYTSGTTGRPKGVHRRGAALGARVGNFCGYDEDWAHSVDAHLCAGPCYHAAPLLFSVALPLSYGAPVVVMDHWEPEEALRLIEHHGVTHTHLVPTMFHRLLSLPQEARASHDLSTLRFVIHGAAPCPVEDKRQLIEWLGPIVTEYYAATEGLGTLVDSATWLAHPGTVGRPMVEGQVKVGDEKGQALPPGEVGLVFLRAPDTLRFEYYGDVEKTARAYRDEYFTLGDVGYLDREGYLYLTDRSSDLIISGGVNVYPAEVDAVLLEHPAVADAATIGVPDPEWGEVPKSVVELAGAFEPGEGLAAELIDFTHRRLAHFKCPRTVDFTDGLPREDTGKIFKRRLRQQYRLESGPRPEGPPGAG